MPERINPRTPIVQRQAVRHLRALQYAAAYREDGSWKEVCARLGVSLGVIQRTMRAACPPALFAGLPARICAQCGAPFDPSHRTGRLHCSARCRMCTVFDRRQALRRRVGRKPDAFRPEAPLVSIAHAAGADIEAASRE